MLTRRVTTALLVVPVALIALASSQDNGYWTGDESPPSSPQRQRQRRPVDAMTDATNRLGVEALHEHAFLNENNVALSPYGLAGILVALYEGVDGLSSLQIARALRLPDDRSAVRVGFRDIHRRLRSYFIPREGFLAGLSFSNENVTFRKEYRDILNFYGFDFETQKMNDSTTTTGTTESTTMRTESVTTTMSSTTMSSTTMSSTAMPSTMMSTTPESMTMMTTMPMQDETEMPQTTTMTTPRMSSMTEATTVTTTSTTTTTTTTPRTTTTTTPTTTTTDSSILAVAVDDEQTTTAAPEASPMEATTQATMAMTTSQESSENAQDESSTESGETPAPMTTTQKSSTLLITTEPVEDPNETTSSSTLLITSTPPQEEQQEGAEESSRERRSLYYYQDVPQMYYGGEDQFAFVDRPPLFGYDKQNSYYESPEHYQNQYHTPRWPTWFLANGYDRVRATYMTYDAVLEHARLPQLRCSALRLPLDTREYYLLVLLPDREFGVNALLRDLRATSLADVAARALRPTRVRAAVPAFALRGFVALTGDLQKLGVCDVFEPRHDDFKPMTDEKNIYVRNIEQSITVTIRKYMEPGGVKKRYVQYQAPVEFSATHPFLYFVMDAGLHVSLMAGKIVNPLNSRIL